MGSDVFEPVRAGDFGVIAAEAAPWLILQSQVERLASETPRWTDVPGIDAEVRDLLKWGSCPAQRVASRISDVTAFGGWVSLLWILGDQRAGSENRENVTMVWESAVLASSLNQVVKFTVGRARPLTQGDCNLETGRDRNLSFYSGHTTFAFATATAAGRIAHLRDSRHEKAVWITGMALAGASGYLRIAADKHYLTDVLVGAATGSAIALLVVDSHRKSVPDEVALSPAEPPSPVRLGVSTDFQRWTVGFR